MTEENPLDDSTHASSGPAARGLEGVLLRLTRGQCLLILLAAGILLLFSNTMSLPVGDPDEARCVVVVHSMLHDGHWLLPELKGQLYYDKPAPFFWLAAAGQCLTGDIELGGRLIAILAAIAAIIATASLVRKILRASGHAGDHFIPLLAGIFLITSPFFFYLGRFYRMDMPFAAFIWLSLWWFWRYEDRDKTTFMHIRQWTGFFAFCGAATLMKGPAGLVLPGMVVAFYEIILKRWTLIGAAFAALAVHIVWNFAGGYTLLAHVTPRLLAGGCDRFTAGWIGAAAIVGWNLVLAGIAALLARGRKADSLAAIMSAIIIGICKYLIVAVPFYYIVSIYNEEYFQKFFVEQNVGRYSQTIGKNDMPAIIYIPLVFGGLLPWSVYLPGAAIRLFPRRLSAWRDNPSTTFLWLAAIIPLVFFSLSQTRLLGYVLPVLPPLSALIALGIGDWFYSNPGDRLFRFHGSNAIISATALMGVTGLSIELFFGWATPWSIIPVISTIAILALMIKAVREKLYRAMLAWAIVGMTVLLTCAIYFTAPQIYNMQSAAELAMTARKMPDGITNETVVCYWPTRRFSFDVYTNHYESPRFRDPEEKNETIWTFLADWQKKFSPEEPRTDTFDDFLTLWASPQKVFCLVQDKPGKNRLQLLEERLPGSIILVDKFRDFTLIRNRPQAASRPATAPAASKAVSP